MLNSKIEIYYAHYLSGRQKLNHEALKYTSKWLVWVGPNNWFSH